MSETIVGIDLGTTNSCVAWFDGGTPVVIPARGGQRTIPSVVAITPSGKRLVGHVAKGQAITNPEHTAYAVKRLIGRPWGSEPVRAAVGRLPYKIVDGGAYGVQVELRGQVFTLSELQAFVLAEMKRVAEEHFGRPVSKAVITVPAHFNDNQRQATKDAARIAQIEAVRMLNEPTAAALAYGFGAEKGDRTIAVYDLGGGTFDISVLRQRGRTFHVLASSGDTLLGGEDFDGRLIQWLNWCFQEQNEIDLLADRMAVQRLKEAAERVKHELSTLKVANLNLPFMATSPSKQPLHLEMSIDRAKFEELTQDLVDGTVETCRKVLADAKLAPSGIDEVLLVGGMTRMPRVQKVVSEFFGRPPCKGVHPDEAVALGAAIYAAAVARGDAEEILGDVTSHSLGLLVSGGKFQPIIQRNARLPTSACQRFTTVRQGQDTIDIVIMQGEDEDGDNNHCLGRFSLDGLPRLEAGAVEIEVTFAISTDGMIGVTAKDEKTGRQQAVSVAPASGLSEEEIARMAEDTRQNAIVERVNEERSRKQQSMEKLVVEAERLLPQVIRAMNRTNVDWKAINDARGLIERARQSSVHDDERRFDAMSRELAETVKSFRTWAGQP